MQAIALANLQGADFPDDYIEEFAEVKEVDITDYCTKEKDFKQLPIAVSMAVMAMVLQYKLKDKPKTEK